MSIIRLYFLYLRQRFRFFSSIKIFIVIVVLFIIIFHTKLIKQNDQWCDPTKPLWWFCPWPGPETVCSWDQHFPILNGNIRYFVFFFSSKEKYKENEIACSSI